ncbi:MAG: methyltransferase domain-containing protein [Deltaproteobacteria bacterium]|nr:methyltransferase domain-containing protein [Deltaproteobacteria bacterium]
MRKLPALGMTPFEVAYLLATPVLPPLHGLMRARLRRIVATLPGSPEILDVGGRKSHCTIGLRGRITVSDLPRSSSIQESLHLGLNDSIRAQTLERRSNLAAVIYDDMTRTSLAPEAFDCVMAIEVLEHVEDDDAFVANIRRVLRPGGVFLMSTPNGDHLPVPMGDHKRHYRKAQLEALLGSALHDVRCEYAIVGGMYRGLGLKSWSSGAPLQTTLSMLGNLINHAQSMPYAPGAKSARGTHHIVATAIK